MQNYTKAQQLPAVNYTASSCGAILSSSSNLTEWREEFFGLNWSIRAWEFICLSTPTSKFTTSIVFYATLLTLVLVGAITNNWGSAAMREIGIAHIL
jgi:hypothetical protein